MFYVVGPIEAYGLDSYRKSWVEQFFSWHRESGGRFDLQNLRLSAGPDVTFASALLQCAGTEEGTRVSFTLRLTIGLEKVGGGTWTIVHERHSEPLPFGDSKIGKGKRAR